MCGGSVCKCIKCLCQKIDNIIQPYCVGQTYKIGDRVGTDNTLYICIKDNNGLPETMPPNTEFWLADFGNWIENQIIPLNKSNTQKKKNILTRISDENN